MSLEYYINEYYKLGKFEEFYERIKNERICENVDPVNDIVNYYLWLYRGSSKLEQLAHIRGKDDQKEEDKVDSIVYLEKLLKFAEKCDNYFKTIIYNEAFDHYQSVDELKQAEKYLLLLEKIEPKSIKTIESRAYFEYLNGRYEEAGKHYDRLSKVDEMKYIKKKFLCLVKSDFHNVALVESYINQKGTNDSKNKTYFPEIHELRAEIYRITFDYKRALKEINTAIQLDPKNMRYKITKLRILYYLKDHQTCIEEGTKILQRLEDKEIRDIAPVYFYLSVAKGSDIELEKFEHLVKRRNSEYYYEKARKCLLEKNTEDAKRFLDKSVFIDPCNVFSIQELISIEESLGDQNEKKIEELKQRNKFLLERYRQATTVHNTENNELFENTINLASNLNENNEENFSAENIMTPDFITQTPFTKHIYDEINISEIIKQKYDKYEKDLWGNAIIERIGQGGTSGVSKIYNFGDNQIQAAKYITLNENNSVPSIAPTYSEFKNEVSLMVALQHENIISIKGFERGVIYMEYAEGGDISSLLRDNKDLPEKFKVYVLLCVAKGIKELHSKNIIHGDVKGKNILLDKKYDQNIKEYPIPKICDFGLAGYHNEVPKDNIKGTLGYIPSEYFVNKVKTNEEDIFAFGMTMYEILSGEQPFAKHSQEEKMQFAKEHKLPNFSSFEKEYKNKLNQTNIKQLIYLIEDCTMKNPLERKPIEAIIDALDEIYQKYD